LPSRRYEDGNKRRRLLCRRRFWTFPRRVLQFERVRAGVNTDARAAGHPLHGGREGHRERRRHRPRALRGPVRRAFGDTRLEFIAVVSQGQGGPPLDPFPPRPGRDKMAIIPNTLVPPICPRCSKRSSFYRRQLASGWTVISACLSCGWAVNKDGTSGTGGQLYPKRLFDLEMLPIWEKGIKSGDCPICDYHGVLEQHHLAPSSVFGEASALWPEVAICHDCHERWHRKMEGYRWAAKGMATP